MKFVDHTRLGRQVTDVSKPVTDATPAVPSDCPHHHPVERNCLQRVNIRSTFRLAALIDPAQMVD
jgi:hypothetical protein